MRDIIEPALVRGGFLLRMNGGVAPSASARNQTPSSRSSRTFPRIRRSLNDLSSSRLFEEASLSIEHPLRTPPPDKPWARPTRTRVRTVHSAILRLAGVLQGHNLLRAPHKHLQRLCKIWSLVRVSLVRQQQPGLLQPSHLWLSLACPSSAADAGYRLANS